MQVDIRADEVVDDIIAADEALRMAYLTSSITAIGSYVQPS